MTTPAPTGERPRVTRFASAACVLTALTFAFVGAVAWADDARLTIRTHRALLWLLGASIVPLAVIQAVFFAAALVRVWSAGRKGAVVATMAFLALGLPILEAANILSVRDRFSNESSCCGAVRTVFNAQQVFRDTGKSVRFLGTAHPEYARSLRDL